MIPRLQLRLPGTARMEIPVTCEGPNNPKNTNSFITQGDLIDISAASGCDLISTVCTPPTICQFTKDPAVQRDCVAHPERYAVIPFNGDYSIVRSDLLGADIADKASVKWAVCCGCGESAPNLPGPVKTTVPSHGGPTPTQLCGPPVTEQAQIDRLKDIRKLYVDQLRKLWPEFQEHLNETKDNVEAYRAAIGACAIEEIGQELLTFYVGQNGGKAGEATTKFIGVTQKLMDGDWSFLLPKSAPGTEEEGKLYDLEQAWDIIRNALSGMGAGSPEGMREKIEDCPALPDKLREGALKFVDNMQGYLEMMPELQHLVTLVRQTDLESWNWQYRYYLGCVQYQECKGLDPSTCPMPPEAPR